MGDPRAFASRIALAAALALGPLARAAEPPAEPKKPSTAAAAKPEPLPDMDKDVREQLEILRDTTKPDKARVMARRQLLTDKLLAKGSIAGLIALGKVAASDNVRMHVAIALSHVRRRDDAQPIIENYALLKGWLSAEGADPTLRYWAAMATVNTRTAEAIEMLGPILFSPKQGEEIIAGAVARVLGEWRGDKSHALAVGVLLKMLASKAPAVRVAGVQGLQVGRERVNEAAVVNPLGELVKSDPDEAVWRAAEATLNEVTTGMPVRRLSVPVAATDEVRARLIRIWLFEWAREKKNAAKSATKE